MGEAQNLSQRYKAFINLLHKLGTSKLILNSCVGLTVVAKLMQRLGPAQFVDQQLAVALPPLRNPIFQKNKKSMINSRPH